MSLNWQIVLKIRIIHKLSLNGNLGSIISLLFVMKFYLSRIFQVILLLNICTVQILFCYCVLFENVIKYYNVAVSRRGREASIRQLESDKFKTGKYWTKVFIWHTQIYIRVYTCMCICASFLLSFHTHCVHAHIFICPWHANAWVDMQRPSDYMRPIPMPAPEQANHKYIFIFVMCMCVMSIYLPAKRLF